MALSSEGSQVSSEPFLCHGGHCCTYHPYLGDGVLLAFIGGHHMPWGNGLKSPNALPWWPCGGATAAWSAFAPTLLVREEWAGRGTRSSGAPHRGQPL